PRPGRSREGPGPAARRGRRRLGGLEVAADPQDIAAVRFEIGDTDADSQQFSDQQIEYALTAEGGVRGAAAACLESLARRYAHLADISTGDLRVSYRGAAKALAEQA